MFTKMSDLFLILALVTMRSHIGWRGERSILYKSVETFPYQTCFKTLRGNLEGKFQREQYLLAVSLGYYSYTLPLYSTGTQKEILKQ